MKTSGLAVVLALLAACSAPGNETASARRAGSSQTPVSTGLVHAEPLSGRRVRISIHAGTQSLSIANCNQHVVVALLREGSDIPVWGGVSDACLSPAIIVPAQSTLGFVVDLGAQAPGLDDHTPYRARIFNVQQDVGPDALPLSPAQVTSAAFVLLP